MAIGKGTTLLRGKYEILHEREATGDAAAWEAVDEDGARHLVRTWSYEGAEPDRVQRALWDAELRTLYKVGSSPGAADTLAVLKDAGLDRGAKCFAMVIEAPGYETLGAALAGRGAHPWLSPTDSADRSALWRAAGRIAAGLAVLHSQQVLHRDVGADAVLVSPAEGPESLRLADFEWSVRLGRTLDADPPVGWASPPERVGGDADVWRPDDDWFGFGMLCARMMLDVEKHAENAPADRHGRVLKAVEGAAKALTQPERTLIARLIAVDPLERVTRAHDVADAVREIERLLAAPPSRRQDR